MPGQGASINIQRKGEIVKILNLDNWCEAAKRILEEVAEVEKWNADYFTTMFKHEGVIVDLGEEINLRLFPNLKFIASCTTGLDHIDTGCCREKGIKIISLQGETEFLKDVHATSEHVFALILSLIRKAPWAFDDVKQGNWDREKWRGTELHGKTLGIVGYGRVGQQVGEIAKAFGMKVIAYESYNSKWRDETNPPFRGYEVEFCTFETVLSNADIITIHVPLTPNTRGMFSYEHFDMMKPTAYFVNTSRGAIVREDVLLYALYNNKIAGAAIDVIENEPEISLALQDYARNHDNLLISPHLGGNTAESREKTQCFIANKIKEFITGGG